MSVPRVCGDRWPVRVTTPDGGLLEGRAVLTVADDERLPLLWVWTREAVDGAPRLAVRVVWTPEASRVPRGAAPWDIATSDGHYRVDGSRGCRCSPLLARPPWQPFQLVRTPPNLATINAPAGR